MCWWEIRLFVLLEKGLNLHWWPSRALLFFALSIQVKEAEWSGPKPFIWSSLLQKVREFECICLMPWNALFLSIGDTQRKELYISFSIRKEWVCGFVAFPLDASRNAAVTVKTRLQPASTVDNMTQNRPSTLCSRLFQNVWSRCGSCVQSDEWSRLSVPRPHVRLRASAAS